MGLKMASAEATKGFTFGLPTSLVAAASLLMMAAIAGGFPKFDLDIATIESSFYSRASANGTINFGGGYAYY